MCVCNVHSSLQLNKYYMYMISEFSTMNVYFIIYHNHTVIIP